MTDAVERTQDLTQFAAQFSPTTFFILVLVNERNAVVFLNSFESKYICNLFLFLSSKIATMPPGLVLLVDLSSVDTSFLVISRTLDEMDNIETK